MTWFRVDDGLHDHRKARKAGTEAMGLWVLSGSWSSKTETDGFIPTEIVKRYGTVRLAQRLVDAGLWHVDAHDGEQGYRFHEWSPTNPTHADLQDQRRSARERMGRVRANSSGTNGSSSATPSLPIPSTPNPSDEGTCSKIDKPHPNCRGCGTNLRSVRAEQQRRADRTKCPEHHLRQPCSSCAADLKAVTEETG